MQLSTTETWRLGWITRKEYMEMSGGYKLRFGKVAAKVKQVPADKHRYNQIWATLNYTDSQRRKAKITLPPVKLKEPKW